MAYSLAEWAVGSRAYLMRVPWGPDYKDIVGWSVDERDAYFRAHRAASWTLEDMQYLKPNEPVRVPLMYDDCWRANYLVVENAQCPSASETPPTLCYFVTNVGYVNPNTSTLELQLDVWQTFALTARFGNCYVERGHIVAKAWDGFYRADGGSYPDYDMASDADKQIDEQRRWRANSRYMLEAEGLDVGSDYTVGYHGHVDLTTWENRAGEGGEIGAVIVSSVRLGGDWGTTSAPEVNTPGARVVSGTIMNLDVYYMTISDYRGLISDMREYPWISKGISNVYVVPRSFLDLVGTPERLGPNKRAAYVVTGGADGFSSPTRGDSLFYEGIHELLRTCLPAWSENADSPKFETWPYAYIMIDTNEGSPLVLKPELVGGNLNLTLAGTVAPPTFKIGIRPDGYGSSAVTPANGVNMYTYLDATNSPKQAQTATGYGWQTVAWIQNAIQTQVVNDEYNYYLASTYNTRLASYQGASWSQAKSVAASGLSYNQTLANLATAQQNNQLRNQQVQNSILAGIGQGALGAVGALTSGNVFGAVSNAASTAISAGTQYANNELTNAMFNNNQTTALALAGQNLGLAQWAAQGDYAQTVRQLQASVQDAAVTQPSVSGMASGDAFNLDHGLIGFDVYVMVPNWGRLYALADYFCRYGYTCNRIIDLSRISLVPMETYTYWKMAECEIPEWSGDDGTRDVVRGIMQRGVTVWREADAIGHAGITGYRNRVAEAGTWYY